MLYQMPNPHGGDIYHQDIELDFSANVNPLGPPPSVLEAVQDTLSYIGCYPDPNCTALVDAIAAHEQVDRANILCGNGAAELIYAYCAAVKPKRAAELAPTFAEYSLALENVGCTVGRFRLIPENDFMLPEIFLAALEKAAPDVVFLCNPNNPTGRAIPADMLWKILKICKKKNIRLFLDECFVELSDCAVSMKAVLDENPNLFILRAFTKTYAMAGLRLGYGLCADHALLAAMSKHCQPWNVSVPAQAAGIAALQENDYVTKAKALIWLERQWLTEQLLAMGHAVCPSDANYLLFFSGIALDEPLLRQGIAIRSCANYHGLGSGWYRIAVRTHEENERLIAALRRI